MPRVLLLLGFPPMLVMGRVAMSDVPSTAWVALGFLAFWRGLDAKGRAGALWWLGSGFVAGASMALRASNPVLFVPLFAGSVLRRELNAWALVVGGIAGLGVRLLSQAILFGNALYERDAYRFSPETVDERLWLYLLALLVFVPGGLVLSVLYRGRRRPEVIITMGCAEKCPFVPGARRLDWNLPDPAGKSAEFMREVRDEIEKRVKNLIAEFDSK